MLGKSFRIELATDITRRVEKLEWDVRALTLSQFGLQDTDGDRFSPSLLEVVGTATDEVLADLGEHFGIIIPDTGDAPASSVTTTVKTAEPLFVFASHISAHKALVGEVKVALAVYGVYLFVAHDSIAVDAAWHEEIEKGLDRADAGVAFIHDGFQRARGATKRSVGFLADTCQLLPSNSIRLRMDPSARAKRCLPAD